MKKCLMVIILSVLLLPVSAQIQKPEDLGYRQLQYVYKQDTVDIIIKSKKGEEQKRKPIFLFIQGSLPIPLFIRFPQNRSIEPFPFSCDSLLNNYHLVIISKPFVPVMVGAENVQADFTFIDKTTGTFPAGYVQHNLLDNYVNRDLAVLKFLRRQSWVSSAKLVVAGHSEGSTIAAKLCLKTQKITHLIYASGNPLGRMLTIVARSRRAETDFNHLADKDFSYWKSIVDNPANMEGAAGDTHKALYYFSIPPIEYLEKIKIPVLVLYGTKDYSAYSNDFLHLETIRKKKKNFTFSGYTGLEHNFFRVTENGDPDYDAGNWDTVATDWWHWLKKN